MNFKQATTAVLYFTRSADEEARAKSFCTSSTFTQNKAIAQELITHSYRQVQCSGFPVKVFTSRLQQGRSFGEKLSNAFQALFDEGYENVIAVGNDCPYLSADIVKHAASLLQEHPLVAGPASDGGTYLIGISQKVFNKHAFNQLAWETNGLLQDFILYAQDYGYNLRQLPEFADIDNEEGLYQFIQQARKSVFYINLVALFLNILHGPINDCGAFVTGFFSHHLGVSLFHRGPPGS